jgi:hypothetical protein
MCHAQLELKDLFALLKSPAGKPGRKQLPFIILCRGFRRAAARRSSRTSVRKHYTLVARYIEHFGSSLPGRGLRAARCVISIGAAQRRPRSWMKNNRVRRVYSPFEPRVLSVELLLFAPSRPGP